MTNIYEPESLNMEASQPNYDISAASLKSKLENSLQTAKLLTETLKMQINALTLKEVELKEAIANGRYMYIILLYKLGVAILYVNY